ncbi:MAG: hypothetical protein BWZ01_00829 [Deltaproteobacteria bacterium ADurb.BinA179]|mgnify:CR=1 FL=1|jgi:hypothetical protein|nr:hypothetical protein [Deltaproteobacteria bacterium]MDI9542271.1 hypothetical protein [Pseudomonadota bacterium]NLW67728.1 hypothetical protein [Bacteriovoracaceae bacterium]OPZ29081.1 MAG: hypothetical protein BWZ01_00829 [Deltaproteobacteria bacterium ADurb.BinA179]HRR21352.1 hypothetical protein [Desulfomonilia bacterium]
MWKIPPREKIYEALTAVADGRVKITGAHEAEVISSSGSTTYLVRFDDDITRVASNDNASRWQGYLGYPILAVLMVLGKLRYDPEAAMLLAGIPWKEINKKYRNDYANAVDSVLASCRERGVDVRKIEEEVDALWRQITALELEKLPGTRT